MEIIQLIPLILLWLLEPHPLNRRHLNVPLIVGRCNYIYPAEIDEIMCSNEICDSMGKNVGTLGAWLIN